MAKTIAYVQCMMTRSVAPVTFTTLSWIPKRFAQVGKQLRLRNDDDQWEDGWIVETVGSTVVSSRDLTDPRQSIRGHRRQTGDSLPRSESK